MYEKQDQMWDVLAEQSGETVLKLMTDWHGLQLLDEGLYEHLLDEGYIAEVVDFEQGDEGDDEYVWRRPGWL